LLDEHEKLSGQLMAVGHRVVHGGEDFTHSVIIDEAVITQIRACNNLAPLHNPANLMGILGVQHAFPHLPQVAVFDTAFHQTMPEHAYLYAIPYELYEKYAIRRYGFHGTSHRYVIWQAAKLLNKPVEKSAFISAHLGNGCSVAAVLNGESLDTSMGLTPLEGLVMGTRAGDVDPSLHAFLADTLGYDVHKVTSMLNKQSGLLGLSGLGSDMRTIEEAAISGNKRAILTEDIFAYRLAKYVASYMVPLGHLDALIFTGGIGENGAIIRAKIIRWLKVFGFALDEERNQQHGRKSKNIITREGTPIAMVIPTNEELMIAQDAMSLTTAKVRA
jgi:acetate kinase